MTKVITANVVNGIANVALPKLPSGSWSVSIAYQGDSNYAASTVSVASVKVK